jgi:hypothetical protein
LHSYKKKALKKARAGNDRFSTGWFICKKNILGLVCRYKKNVYVFVRATKYQLDDYEIDRYSPIDEGIATFKTGNNLKSVRTTFLQAEKFARKDLKTGSTWSAIKLAFRKPVSTSSVGY